MGLDGAMRNGETIVYIYRSHRRKAEPRFVIYKDGKGN